MNEYTPLTHAAFGLLGLFLLWWYGFRRQAADQFVVNCLAIRADLERIAAGAPAVFGSTAWSNLYNAAGRFAENAGCFTPLRLVLFQLLHKVPHEVPHDQPHEVPPGEQSIPAELVPELDAVRQRFTRTVRHYFLCGFPFSGWIGWLYFFGGSAVRHQRGLPPPRCLLMTDSFLLQSQSLANARVRL